MEKAIFEKKVVLTFFFDVEDAFEKVKTNICEALQVTGQLRDVSVEVFGISHRRLSLGDHSEWSLSVASVMESHNEKSS